MTQLNVSKHYWIAAIALSALCMAYHARPAKAQAQEMPQGQSSMTAYGDWTLRCGARGGRSQCDLLQLVADGASRKLVLTAVLSPASDGKLNAEFAVPLGVDLARGIEVIIGRTSLKSLQITRCEAIGCIVDTQLSTETVNVMSSSDRGEVHFYAGGKSQGSIGFSLKGFDSGLKALRASPNSMFKEVPSSPTSTSNR